jgi:signal transduction histidine kinase
MRKILIVEDEQSLREDLSELLGYEGFEVYSAENGLLGVQKAKEIVPDLIVCDVMMPEMDGYQVLSELRTTLKTTQVPFIFLTAKASRSDMRRGMELGADDYLTKPFTHQELLACIYSRLEKHAQMNRAHQQQLNDLRENVIRALPHELRTPLTGILGYAQMLMDDLPNLSQTQIQRIAESIDRSARRLHRLTENYLLYARLEVISRDAARRALFQQGTCHHLDFLDEIAVQKAEEYNRLSDLQINVQSHPLKISSESLQRAFYEIVDNAFKFSSPQTPIVIEGRLEDKVYYLLSVLDKGRGMMPDQLEYVGAYMQFERRLYEQSGLGLGLVLAQRLVDLHDGKFLIESIPDQETRVSLRLRLA